MSVIYIERERFFGSLAMLKFEITHEMEAQQQKNRLNDISNM